MSAFHGAVACQRPVNNAGQLMVEHALRGELRHGESMARHVSWRAGGVVESAYFPADLADLQDFLRSLPASEPVVMVGLGSNLLVRDGGLPGTAIFTHRALRELNTAPDADGLTIYAQAGVAAPKVARYAARHGLAGAEFLAGIPGTVGGALAMNAGCYGGDTWGLVTAVTTVDRSGRLRSRPLSDYQARYRYVQLCPADGPAADLAVPSASRDEWFVAATFHLRRGDPAKSRALIRDLLERRIRSQPLDQPNAGSVFRNPPGAHAARLIEDCGLKGSMVGGAMISPKHANFIVNLGHARAVDIETLIELARASVYQKFGVLLQREVLILGDEAAGEAARG